MQRNPRRRPSTTWPDIVVSTAATSDTILRAVANGELKPLVRPFYSPAMEV